ncbi:MAG: LysR family transcriptional regulator [Sphingobium sp.]|nr:LysR family transcriptional regulator [Sphingobium sp.]
MDRPTLRQLEALDAIAREGSFRAAARALGVSQVAISDHIKQLETRLGVSLFERARGGKAAISAAGAAALARARIILADCDALVLTMRDHARVAPQAPQAAPAKVAGPITSIPVELAAPEAEDLPDLPVEAPDAHWAPHARSDQPITIGIHPSILARFQAKVAAFEDAFPHRPVTIDYNCFVADRVALALSEDRVTIAYFYTLGATRVFPSDYLWSERWSLYVGRDHPLAALEFVGRDDIAEHSLLTFAAANRLRPLVDACLSGGGLGAMPVALESDDYGQLAERAREGAGILPLFGAAAARIGASAGLKRLPFVDPIPAIEVRRVVHPSVADDDEVQALVATLQ